ncbi:Dehydrodolichyl diphosphate syntase complex subunit Nus1 [Oopsacas minuta]|uniref:ditrans,polycis-polyprenyl diphosphate synthase [(2E,6E)-farnesyldiphosphate specific] n=1 Tax=Oopsacas minuta TaxID=111878 RepID=A0AAV7KIA8_9METZ|nr:Dehydrodolichyl diphosphate syntase complex subunit Nus1 [Oopsacas minuta]
MKKIPTHLALIFNETYYRSKSIAELLNWCYMLRIQTITLYSEEGIEEKIRNEILRDLRKMFSRQITQDGNKTIMQQLDVCASDMKNRNLEIMFIDRMNGKPAIAKVATNYLSNHKQELCVEEFEKKVFLESEFKPPELAIIFGPAFSACGYPPWHLQFTEMYHFQTHRYIHWRSVLDVFTSFAKTKQNYGK